MPPLSLHTYIPTDLPTYTQGLRDEDIVEIHLLKSATPHRHDDRMLAYELMAQCYTNLAMAYYKQGEMKVGMYVGR